MQDKDKSIKSLGEQIKPKQEQNNDLKKIIAELERKLQLEKERNRHLEQDNTQLKGQIQNLLSIPQMQIQSTRSQSEACQKELELFNILEDSRLNTGSNFYSDNYLTTNRNFPTKLEPQKFDPRIDINSNPQLQHIGPNSTVKKSQTYLQGLTNSKQIDATKGGIPQKSNRIEETNNSLLKSSQINNQSNDYLEGQEIQLNRNSIGKQQCIDPIEENRIETQEVSALQQPALKLYEKFFILGCEKKEFIEFDKDPTIKEGILPTNILYKSDQENISAFEELINGFVHPFGNQVEKIRINDSFEKLQQIIYSCHKYELLDKFQVFIIKNHDTTTKDFIKYANQELMYQANPEKLLYGICLSVNDYVETTPDNIVSTFENRKNRIFWKYKKTYCFLTYFPFYELFQDLLFSIIQLIKINRSDRQIKKMSEENEVLREIDGQQIIFEFQDELTKFLNEIQAIRPMPGHQLFEFQTPAGMLKYRIPNQLQLDIDLRLWSANVTLQVLNYNEILTIFLEMISEISIIFTCQNGSILTSIVHFFHHLIRPLELTQGIIYNLPEHLLPMIQSPVPIIVGVNLPESDFIDMKLTDHCENHLFVFLDRDNENKFLHKPSNILEQKPIPSFGGLLKEIETTLEDYNRKYTQSPSKGQSNKLDDKKVIKFYFDERDQSTSNVVLQSFKKIINDFIISKLPSYDEEGVQVIYEKEDVQAMQEKEGFQVIQDKEGVQVIQKKEGLQVVIQEIEGVKVVIKKKEGFQVIQDKEGVQVISEKEGVQIVIQNKEGIQVVIKKKEGVQVAIQEKGGVQTEKKSLNFEFIEHYLTYENDPEDREFIQKLFKTHYFQYFMQQHYEAQM